MRVALTYIVVIGLSVLFGGVVGYCYVKLFIKFYEWFIYWWACVLPEKTSILRSKLDAKRGKPWSVPMHDGGDHDVHVQ